MTKINDDIDAMVMKAAGAEWQKTAVLISKVFDDPNFDKEVLSGQNVAERIYALLDAEKLEATGNIRRWRESNVRLKKGA